MDLRKTYNTISKQFSATRYKKWPCVVNYYEKYVSKNNYILDAGCGNGKNITDDCIFECCDVTDNFLNIVQNQHSCGLVQTKVESLPYKSDTFDHIICIAVVHHLNTEELRIKAIKELVRCVKPGGTILVTNWAFENNKFDTQDAFIPFKTCKGDILVERYYHLFTENELPHIISLLSDCELIEYYNEYCNWIGVIKKLKVQI